MRVTEQLKRNALPFAAGMCTGACLLLEGPAGPDGLATSLVPIAALTARSPTLWSVNAEPGVVF